MPVVAELYGQRLTKSEMDLDVYGQRPTKSEMDLDICRHAHCAFTESTCDGGGNRDMARVEAHDSSIGHLFSPSVGRDTGGWLPCGVCSVDFATGKTWAICPHRLFAIGPRGIASKHRALARKLFAVAGFRSGQEVSVWSEITLREKSKTGSSFNYRLDYVLRGKGRNAPPIIVEIMTCSTSGGNRSQGTDIQAAFKRAVLFAHTPADEPVRSPGVNVRQVWARMASQLVAKSEAANSWGGRTIWIVQDLLADYIRTQTALPLDQLISPGWTPDEVNMVVADLNGPLALYAGPIRSRNSDRRCWLEILGAPHLPSIASISDKLAAKSPLATVRAP